ncbi:MAG: hypothetical protein ACOYMZ_03330 [Minisyncoccia bacterium]
MSSHDTQKGPNSQDIFTVWKHPGETLAVLLERFRQEHSLSSDSKLTYAGRLDPMAEGVVLILAGDARFHKDTLLGADKTYELTVLFGIQTDTADMLGMVTAIEIGKSLTTEVIEGAVKNLEKVTELPYPAYSSRPVDGVPLFVHAREGNAVELPIKEVKMNAVELLLIERTTLGRLIDETVPVIEQVAGDFRQEEIVKGWSRIKTTHGEKEITLVKIQVTASSGTYMRALAELLGSTLGVSALAYHIKRVRVGKYSI